MKTYNSFNEMADGIDALVPQEQSSDNAFNEWRAAIDNMSPASVELGNMKIYVGGEDQKKPPHVHADFPGRTIKFVLGSNVQEVAVAPKGMKGNVTDDDLTTATEQVKAHYDKLKEDYYNQFKDIPIQKITGKKIKAEDRKRWSR